MNKTLALFALILLLSAASCNPIPAASPSPIPPEPLVLPYLLYERDFCGNQVRITLYLTCAQDRVPSGEYCYHIDIHTGEGQTEVGATVIEIPLTEGYQPGAPVDWRERVGDTKGSGWLSKGPIQPGTDDWGAVGFGLGGEVNYPVAVFVRVTGTDQGTILTRLDTTSPVAVLQAPARWPGYCPPGPLARPVSPVPCLGSPGSSPAGMAAICDLTSCQHQT